MKSFLGIIVLVCAVVSVQAQQQKVMADKIIAIVGDKVVLKSDLDNTIEDMKRQGNDVPDDAACAILESQMSMKALVLQAEKDSLPISDEEVDAEIEQRVRYFIRMYGGKEALEEISGRTIYQMKEDFKQPIREGRLAQAMRSKIIEQVKITPTETKVYFEKIPKDSLPFYETELEIGQIVSYPKASRDLEKYAQDELTEYKRQIEAGISNFDALARLNSDDPGSKESGGRYELNRNDKNSWDPVFLNTAFSLKEGQVSRIVKSKFGYHIIQMVSRNGDDAVVRHILKIPKVTASDISESKKKLDSVRAKLITGNISFGEAVAKHSDDENSKFTAGMIMNQEGSTILTIDQLDKDLVNMLGQLKVGEYSQPVDFVDERGTKAVRVIYLSKKTEPHRENLQDDYSKIARKALQEKQAIAIESWFKEKMPGYYLMVDKEYSDCQQVSNWLKASARN